MHKGPTLELQHSGTTSRLQAISPVNARVAWASGLGGTYAVTTNGGRHWRAGVVPGAELLQFRDVHGVSAKVAYLLAAGVGTDSPRTIPPPSTTASTSGIRDAGW